MIVLEEYSEDKACEFIAGQLEEAGISCSRDLITEILALVWDGYESLGLIEIADDLSDDVDAETEQVSDYVLENLKGFSEVDREMVRMIVNAEVYYEMSLI